MLSFCQEIGYFAGLKMTSRRKNLRDVMFFAIFTDKERKRAKSLHIHLYYNKSLKK